MAFVNLNDIAGLARAMLKYVFKAALEGRVGGIEFSAGCIGEDAVSCLGRFIKADFTQVDYTDAVTILENCGRKFENPVYWGVDLSSEHECHPVEKCFKAPVVVKNYPKGTRAFYMRLNEGGRTAVIMDVLAPGIGRIIDGSQREERLDVLDECMFEMDLNKEGYWWYRDLRRCGTAPHSGLGLGFERLIAHVTSVQNVCDVIPFPRTPRNASL